MHYYGKTTFPLGASLIDRASLFKHHLWPIYSQIRLLVSEEKIFKELICIIIGKTAPPPWEPNLMTEQVCFSNFGRESLDDHLCLSTFKSAY